MKSIILTFLLIACVSAQDGYDKYTPWNNYLTRESTTSYNPVLSTTDLLLRSDIGVTTDAGGVTVWADQSGNNRNFEDINQATSPDLTNNEIVFESGNNETLLCLATTFNKNYGTGDFTISIRFKKTTLATYDALISWGGGGQTDEFQFGMFATNNILTYSYNNTALNSSTAINNTNYYVTTVVRSGNTGTIYLDGDIVASNATFFANLNLAGNNGYEWAISGRLNGGSHGFEGIITDIRIDHTALSLAEINDYISWINYGRQ